MISLDDTTFSVNAAMTEEDAKRGGDSGGKEVSKTDVIIPARSEVIYDIAAVHHNRTCSRDQFTAPLIDLSAHWFILNSALSIAIG